ncbi:tRNA modification GTPase MnmE [Bacteroidia bacterium]|nr:tRNA modification GTPase MnmE [Bacteroidia bacterium]
MNTSDTIVAPATAPGGAIAVIRVSGSDAIALCGTVFWPLKAMVVQRDANEEVAADSAETPGKTESALGATVGALAAAKGYTLHYGTIVDGERVIDQVLVSLFRAPRSYTGEDMVEISCHGSPYIRAEIVRLLVERGARPAGPGEFTVRAFLAGKMDLSQAEAVADTIAAEERASHALASNQMRGGYSADLARLRARLVELASLLELELDFAEEDVNFADRRELRQAVEEIAERIDALLSSFRVGNAIKEGVTVAIVGDANVGKSTLLNRLLHDERAMVSQIAGTTRDTLEERLTIDGTLFRLIDTAGIRPTEDTLELMGIERSLSAAHRARIVLLVCDMSAARDDASLAREIAALNLRSDQQLCIVLNKADLGGPSITMPTAMPIASGASTASAAATALPGEAAGYPAIALSAKTGTGIDRLTAWLSASTGVEAVYGGDTVLSNSRHVEALTRAREALTRVEEGIAATLPTDLLTQELRQAIHHIGTITGQITTDEILGEIFSRFCIGK